jgi:hypothetical protein
MSQFTLSLRIFFMHTVTGQGPTREVPIRVLPLYQKEGINAYEN